MSARDSASGSSDWHGGGGSINNSGGGTSNGGIGGGQGGGIGGGGAGRNGGYGSQTGLTTGTDWHGNTAYGRAGGNVQAYGMRDARSLRDAGMGPTMGTYGNFQTPQGQPMYGSSPVQGQSFYGMNMGQALSQANRAQAAWQAAQSRGLGQPPHVGGLLDPHLGNIQPASGVSPPQYAPPAWAPPYQSMPAEFVGQPASPWSRSMYLHNQYSQPTRSYPLTDAGGYPSVLHDTRPAGVY